MKNLVKDLTDFVVSVSPDPCSIDLPPVGYQLDLKRKTVTHTKDIIEDWSLYVKTVTHLTPFSSCPPQ